MHDRPMNCARLRHHEDYVCMAEFQWTAGVTSFMQLCTFHLMNYMCQIMHNKKGLTSLGLPMHWNWPSTKIPSRSQSTSASSMECAARATNQIRSGQTVGAHTSNQRDAQHRQDKEATRNPGYTEADSSQAVI
jgi:hypothetical protein